MTKNPTKKRPTPPATGDDGERLDRRYMIRTHDAELERWDACARSKGFASAGAWLRSLGNKACPA